ncbi:MAG: threonine/serine dehydratase [Actinomycetota bacterium]
MTPSSAAGDPTPQAVAAAVDAADARIRPYVRETPLERSPFLSREAGCEVYLKMENLQVTNTFKARGAFNALLSLSDEDRARGVVTASTGNHGNAMAHAMTLLGIDGEIFVASSTSRAKLDQLEARGARLRVLDAETLAVETAARSDAEASGRVYISPYNDSDVVAGQGTIAAELLRQLDSFDDVLVPVGGGGLIAGLAGFLKARDPGVRVTGCLPENSPVISESVAVGELREIPWTPSLSDATVGWAEVGSITFPMCRDWVDGWILVSEAEIAAAIRTVIGYQSVLVEGAGALSVASLLRERDRFAGRTVVLVLSGARIPLTVLAEVLMDG